MARTLPCYPGYEENYGSALVNLQAKGRNPFLRSTVMVVMAVMMVLCGGKCRRSNHRQKQGGEQDFLHGCIVALVWI
jgi:hypothetical protein